MLQSVHRAGFRSTILILRPMCAYKNFHWGYTLPSKWFRNVCKINIAFVGRNLWMVYNKAPFDPEAIATTGNNYQGIDYFMMPSLRNLGFV